MTTEPCRICGKPTKPILMVTLLPGSLSPIEATYPICESKHLDTERPLALGDGLK